MKKNEEFFHVAFWLPTDLKNKFKLKVKRNKSNMNQTVKKLIEDYVKDKDDG